MLRRLLRGRRRIPVQSAGHETTDRRPAEDEGAIHVYHACMNRDGPIPLLLEEALPGRHRFPLPRFDAALFRQRMRNHINHVGNEERNAARAWSRLEQLYAVFQALHVAEDKGRDDAATTSTTTDEPATSSQVLGLLADHGGTDPVVLRDFEELTADLPEGFSSTMFMELGNALYSEMHAGMPPRERQLDRAAFEGLGDRLYAAQTAAVVAVSA